MLDRFNRHINYLRISVTDRCNLRCSYCMPTDGIRLIPREEILSYEEIAEVVRTAVKLGIDKFRLTGGEPLVREGIIDLVGMLSSIEGVKDLSMTTNGILLDKNAYDLKKAGLQRVNISLDTIDANVYKELTRGGRLDDVLKGIDSALENNLRPVKINCVVEKSSEEENAREVKKFCEKNKLEVRFIHRMNLYRGEFSKVEGGMGGSCGNCNRLRLTSNGMVKPCLFDEQEFSVRKMGAESALTTAILRKPAKGSRNRKTSFYNIGG
jgi:cyclic pyranopterin phosphate synthase